MARKCSQHRGTTMPRSLPPKVTPRKNPDVLLAAGRNLHGSPVPFSGSAPEARLGRVLRKAWPPTRKSLALSVCHPQLDLALALPPGHGPVVLHSPVVLHQGPHTKDRHLFLFRDWLVVAKQRSSEGYRLKQKLHLSDVGVIFCNQEQRQDKDRDHKLIHQGNMLCFTMASSPCLTEFPSREVKETWLEALQGSRRGRSGVKFTSGQPAQVLMKLLSSHNASKTLNASDMETFIQCQSEGDIKKHPLLVPSESEDSLCQLIEIKKRKKVLSWPFLMKKLSSSSDFPGASESNLKASLFDQPLSAICRGENTLPKSIQDILTVLCLKGPSTEGIFRKAASEKARKELKEELNSGAAVDLKSLPVHLLAAVFKDFLRSIPQKLLSCDLFEEWMEALEKQNEEDRIEALKLVAEKLPALNLLLLKHLVSVLYLISKNSDTSKMDASNLAICIGPSVLARVQDRGLSLQAQKDLNSKVKTLVEFLIENCLEIFGENIPTHPSTASDDSLEHTDSSDLSTLQNDSAYDSNDPDAEPSSAVSSLNRPLETPGLEPRGPQQAWESSREPLLNTVAKLRGTLGKPDRSYSEPSMFLSQDRPDSPPLMGRQGHFSVALETSSTSENKDSEDPFPEEEFPTTEGKSSRPRDLRLKSLTGGSALKAMSSGSLDASSDGSPGPSPSSPQGSFFSRHQSFTKTEKTKPSREIRKHSLSFSFTSHQRVLAKTSSVGSVGVQGLPRDQGKKGLERGSQLSGRIVRENQCDVPSPVERSFACRPQALSVEDVFRFVDQRSPGSPPSYQEAILCPTAYGSQTVDSMRARVLSLGALAAHHGGSDSRHLCRQDSPNGRSLGHRTEGWHLSRTVCASGKAKGHMAVVLRPELQQLPTGSESKQKTKRGYLVSRCSHPVFEAEQLQYAKESYI